VGWLVGWPIIMFLIAEQLRNLGKYTYADVVATASSGCRCAPWRPPPLIVVILYLIGQMVGAGKLIQVLFGLDYTYAVIIVGMLIILYVTFGGMLATTWVQIIKACLLLGGATIIAFGALYLASDGSMSPERLLPKPSKRAKKDQHHGAGQTGERPGRGDFARSGTDVRHRRPAAYLDAVLHRGQRHRSPQVGVLCHRLHRLLLHPDLPDRLRRHRAADRSIRNFWSFRGRRLKGGQNMAAVNLAAAVGGNLCCSASSRRWPSPPFWRWSPA
jgi:hypothetical protein